MIKLITFAHLLGLAPRRAAISPKVRIEPPALKGSRPSGRTAKPADYSHLRPGAAWDRISQASRAPDSSAQTDAWAGSAERLGVSPLPGGKS